MFQIGKLSVSSLTSTLGTSAIAANAVAGNITTILNVPAIAVGMAVLTVIGQCWVQAKKSRPNTTPAASCWWPTPVPGS